MRTRPRSHPIAMAVCWLLMVFLVLFPKGGFKIGSIPITWGYVIIGLTFPLLLGIRMLALPLIVSRRLLAVALMLLPMQAVFLYSYKVNGVGDFGMAFATFVNLFVFPALFLFVYAPFFPVLDGRRLANYLRFCMLVAAAWGIFLFVWHPLTGHFIEIPFLTVNWGDYGLLEDTKDISRGFFFKLISTYNNGNLYGAATLIVLPMYRVLEPIRWRRAVVMMALFLTLSRSVWGGILFYEALPVLYHMARQAKTFPRVNLSKMSRPLLLTGGVVAIVILVSLLTISSSGGLTAFLFDTSGGGRFARYAGPQVITFLPAVPLQGFTEIIYASALSNFGVAGFFSFTLLMVSPVLLLFMDSSALTSPIRRAALKGLIVYSFVALMDGAFDYIPVAVFYWFAYMVYLYGWPAFQPRRFHRRRLSAIPRSENQGDFSPELSGA